MPRAQYEQRPQAGRKLRTTESPSLTWSTPGPTSTTLPAPSCPPTTGNGIGMSPVTRCSSEWHRPLAVSLTRTSFAFGGSSSASSICHFSCAPYSTAALVFIAPSSPVELVPVRAYTVTRLVTHPKTLLGPPLARGSRPPGGRGGPPP